MWQEMSGRLLLLNTPSTLNHFNTSVKGVVHCKLQLIDGCHASNQKARIPLDLVVGPSTLDSAGGTTCYMQQLRSLLEYNNSIGRHQMPDPHRQFVLDLQSWITMLRQQNISFILSLDGNKILTDKRRSFYPLG